MSSIAFPVKTTKNKRKISFDDKPQYFIIMPTKSEEKFNDNDFQYQSSLATMHTKQCQELKMDKNSNYIQSPGESNDTISHNQTFLEDFDEQSGSDNELEKEDCDDSLEIISDKVVLLMMNTEGVADRYTPAVRNMQEGKKQMISIIRSIKIFESCKSYALLVSCYNFFNLAINRHWKEFAELRRRKEIEYIENTKNIGDLVTKVKLRSEIFQPYLF